MGSGGGTLAHAAKSSELSAAKKVEADFLERVVGSVNWLGMVSPLFEAKLMWKSVTETVIGKPNVQARFEPKVLQTARACWSSVMPAATLLGLILSVGS